MVTRLSGASPHSRQNRNSVHGCRRRLRRNRCQPAAIPLAEIAPGYVHPETDETLREIASRFDSAATGMRKRDDVPLPAPD